jgi:hypothetical protein
MRNVRGLAVAASLALTSVAIGAVEEEGFPVCETQQQLEQLLQSDGQIMPEGCRHATVVTVESAAGTVCALDLSPDDEGILERLRDVAVTTRWWTDCRNLGVNVPR